MKKNPIQYITLFLCAILLPLTIIQNVRLEFQCEDSFGVGYILPCLEIVLEDGYVTDTISMDAPEYYWITDAENCDH